MQEKELIKRRLYAKEYRDCGFGAECDRRYYAKHRDKILQRKRERYRARRDGGPSTDVL